MATKYYSATGILRHFLSFLMITSFVSCGPKTQNSPQSKEDVVKADESLQLSEIQGVWSIESITDKEGKLLENKDGFILPSKSTAKISETDTEGTNKVTAHLEINETHLISKIFINNTIVEKQKDPFTFNKGKMLVETSTDKSLKARELTFQRSGQDLVMIEKGWRMVLRRVTEDMNLSKEQIAANEFIKNHEAQFNRPLLPLINKATAIINFTDIRTFKNSLEKAVTVSEIGYNSKSSNLGNIIYENELQCYSGTALFTVGALKKLSSEQLGNINLVVINTVINGFAHVLPGFILPLNDQFQLFGVEMTTSGDGLINFGITEQIKAPLSVVDALSWVKIETNKEKINNASELAMSAVEQTHQKYKIPMLQNVSHSETPSSKKLHSSPFSFGEEMPDVKKPRPNSANISIYTFEKQSSEPQFKKQPMMPVYDAPSEKRQAPAAPEGDGNGTR